MAPTAHAAAAAAAAPVPPVLPKKKAPPALPPVAPAAAVAADTYTAKPAAAAAAEAAPGDAVSPDLSDISNLVNAQKKFDLSSLNSHRTKRKWGDNNAVDLRDIVDVEIEGDKYDKDFMEYVHGYFLIKDNQASKLASFDSKVLKVPLTKACNTIKSLVKDGCQMSKNITGFMGARKTGKQNFGHAEKIFRYVLLNLHDKSKEDLPPLCDEIYCQLIKMTTSCPEQAIELKGFQLLAILSAVFPCTPVLFPYVMSHCEIKKKLKGQHPEIKELAWKTQRALRRGQDLPLRRLPKGVVPTAAETASIM